MLSLVKFDANPGFRLMDRPEPKIRGPQEVLIEVGACGICGADLHMYHSLPELVSRIPKEGFPRIVGHEIAGTVVETGSEVTDLKKGDHVVGQPATPCGFCFYCSRAQPNLCQRRRSWGVEKEGGFAKYAIGDVHQLFRVPATIPFEEAALIEPFGVVVHAFERSNFKAGDVVVVMGPGPLGILATMLLQASGVKDMVVSGHATSRDRLKLAAELGARTVEVTSPAADNLVEAVRGMTEGRGADVVVDFAGGADSMNQAIRLVRRGGEILLGANGSAGQFNLSRVMLDELTIVGSRALVPSTWTRTINLVANHAVDLRKVLTHVLPLKDFEKAFQLLFSRKAMKVCLIP